MQLPFSPIHYLIFHEAAGRPDGLAWLDTAQPFALATTSGNPHREPPATENSEALARLAGMADAFLMHDRDIVAACDDSIACSGPGGLQLVRRARGYVPRGIKMLQAGPPVLAVGALAKNAFCLTRGDEAYVSPHIGNLARTSVERQFKDSVDHMLRLLEVSPAIVAHDLDGGSPATRFAMQYSVRQGIPLLGVQHHHAHIASILAEHRVAEPVIGIALDGVGMGTDGTVWGGELLRVDGACFERLGHILPYHVADDAYATSSPWALAASVLHWLGRGDEVERRFAKAKKYDRISQSLKNVADCQSTTSMGRLFDATAGLLGLTRDAAFRGQGGLLLEGVAERHGPVAPLADGWACVDGNLDLRPLFAALADETDAPRGASLFHATLAAALADWLQQSAPAGSTVVAGGGCLQNQVLGRLLRNAVSDSGLRLIEARRMPPNDGGLALGQAWIALQYLMRE